jgi:hypothetical protein
MPMSSADQRVNDLGRPSYPTLWPSELNHNVSVSLHCVYTITLTPVYYKFGIEYIFSDVTLLFGQLF